MNKGMYFWKSKHAPNKKLVIILAVLLALVCSGVGGWYYFIYTPQKKAAEELKRKKLDLESKIKKIGEFYQSKLVGGSVDNYIKLLGEIYKSRVNLSMTGYVEDNVSCNTTSCTFIYSMSPTGVFNVQKKYFWDEEYSASFSEKDITFADLPSKLGGNTLLDKYNNNEEIDVPDCGNVLSYIYTFNSVIGSSGEINIVSPPASSVTDIENKVQGPKKRYGLLFGSWEVTTENNILNMMVFFEKQACRDSFIIKSVEMLSSGATISGDFACKSGN